MVVAFKDYQETGKKDKNMASSEVVDQRIQFICEWVLRLFRLKPEIGLKLLNAEHVKTTISSFLEKEAVTRLIFYQVSSNHLTVETDFQKNPKSKCVYFVKREPCVLHKKNFRSQLLYGDLPSAIIEALPVFVNGVSKWNAFIAAAFIPLEHLARKLRLKFTNCVHCSTV